MTKATTADMTNSRKIHPEYLESTLSMASIKRPIETAAIPPPITFDHKEPLTLAAIPKLIATAPANTRKPNMPEPVFPTAPLIDWEIFPESPPDGTQPDTNNTSKYTTKKNNNPFSKHILNLPTMGGLSTSKQAARHSFDC